MKLRLESIGFQAEPVLSELELAVSAGEFVAITGASGIGKTTLLRVIAGLETNWRGHLDLEHMAPVGFVFQEPRLMPWLTALENLRLVCDDRERALAALEAVGLSAELGKYPRQLSGGMQRRVALARAMLLKPRLLLMDEPFVSLDRATAESCRATLLNYWREQGVAVIFVTHDLDEAVALADRVLVLAGRPASVLHELKVDLPRPRDLLSSSVVGVVGELAERLKVD